MIQQNLYAPNSAMRMKASKRIKLLPPTAREVCVRIHASRSD